MNSLQKSTSAIVLAAGKSRRMSMEKNKVLLNLGGITVLEHSLKTFSSLSEISEIILVVSPYEQSEYSGPYLKRIEALGVQKIVMGGSHRFHSVMNGVAAINPDASLVLIHDGARPFPPEKAVKEALRKAHASGAAILAIPLQDTLKQGNEKGVIEKTMPREGLYRAQTPQVFQHGLLKKALNTVEKEKALPTDDAMILETLGHEVLMVEGDPLNIKITTKRDLLMAQALLQTKAIKGTSE